jgi:ligand-binding sensor domain-containing protein
MKLNKLKFLVLGILLVNYACSKKEDTTLKFEHITEYGCVYDISEDNVGRMWFGFMSTGVSILDGNTWSYITEADGLYYKVVRSLFRDNNNAIWIATDGGMNYYSNGTLSKISLNSIGHASDIAQDSKNNLWFSTWSGIYRYDGSQWIHFDKADGINDDFIERVAIDKNDKVWISTLNGIISYDGEIWKNFTGLYDYTQNGNNEEYIPAIMIDSNNNPWAITWGGGVIKYNGSAWVNMSKKGDLSSDFGRAIMEDNAGQIWVGTEAGVSIYNGKTWKNISFESEVECLFKDSAGNIWIGTNKNGAYKYSI